MTAKNSGRSSTHIIIAVNSQNGLHLSIFHNESGVKAIVLFLFQFLRRKRRSPEVCGLTGQANHGIPPGPLARRCSLFAVDQCEAASVAMASIFQLDICFGV